MQQQNIELTVPVATQGMALHCLVAACPPLDPNSVYCNLLHCSHFAATSVAAVRDGELVGFISGYCIPARPDTLFVWQVAVADSARGQGLAGRMLDHIVGRESLAHVQFVETTVTPDNQASWALFESFAKRHGTVLERTVAFDKEQHFDGCHDSEWLARIGPIGH